MLHDRTIAVGALADTSRGTHLALPATLGTTGLPVTGALVALLVLALAVLMLLRSRRAWSAEALEKAEAAMRAESTSDIRGVGAHVPDDVTIVQPDDDAHDDEDVPAAPVTAEAPAHAEPATDVEPTTWAEPTAFADVRTEPEPEPAAPSTPNLFAGALAADLLPQRAAGRGLRRTKGTVRAAGKAKAPGLRGRRAGTAPTVPASSPAPSPSSITPAPVTPAPITPAPVTPAPVTPSSVVPASLLAARAAATTDAGSGTGPHGSEDAGTPWSPLGAGTSSAGSLTGVPAPTQPVVETPGSPVFGALPAPQPAAATVLSALPEQAQPLFAAPVTSFATPPVAAPPAGVGISSLFGAIPLAAAHAAFELEDDAVAPADGEDDYRVGTAHDAHFTVERTTAVAWTIEPLPAQRTGTATTRGQSEPVDRSADESEHELPAAAQPPLAPAATQVGRAGTDVRSMLQGRLEQPMP